MVGLEDVNDLLGYDLIFLTEWCENMTVAVSAVGKMIRRSCLSVEIEAAVVNPDESVWTI